MSMTVKEKKQRAKIRRELRADGILPPKKKPLNRKKFCEEALKSLSELDYFVDGVYIVWALSEMLAHKGGTGTTPDAEAVGAAKVVKLAVRRREFEKKRREEGQTGFTLGELIEAVEDIYKA